MKQVAEIETKKVNIELEVDTNVVDSSKNKYQSWIDMAKAVDAWRIFPRLFLTVYIILLYNTISLLLKMSPNIVFLSTKVSRPLPISDAILLLE